MFTCISDTLTIRCFASIRTSHCHERGFAKFASRPNKQAYPFYRENEEEKYPAKNDGDG